MADKIGIMNDGLLQQYDSPDAVYDHPANLFVAQFVGSPIMNVADCECDAGDGVLARPARRHGRAVRARRCRAARPGARGGARRQPGARRPAGGDGHAAARPASGFVPGHVHLIEPLGAYDIVDVPSARRACACARRAASCARRATRCGSRRRAAHAVVRQAQRPLAAPQRLSR